jgi:hypothetical protein
MLKPELLPIWLLPSSHTVHRHNGGCGRADNSPAEAEIQMEYIYQKTIITTGHG